MRDLRPADLPAPPHVAVKVLEACADPGSDGRRLAGIVASDPSLAAQILRVVNSAYFGIPRKVAKISHAVTILGERALRNFVLCMAVRETLRPEVLYGLDTRRYWETALWRAASARELAGLAGLDPEETFTTGLLLDIGMLAMVYAEPAGVASWDMLLDCDPDERYSREREIFATTHDVAGAELARTWSFPEEITRVIGAHHGHGEEPAAERLGGLVRVAVTADWLASLCGQAEQLDTIRRARQVLHGQWNLEATESDDLVARICDGVSETAAAFGLHLERDVAFDAMMRSANLALAEANLDAMELNWQLQQALEQRDRLARQVQSELDKAQLVQRGLMPADGAGTGESSQTSPIVGINVPARGLSGDFYDFFPLRDGRYFFNLADVSGKGMDAALMMAKSSSLLHCLGKRLPDLGRLLKIVNDEILELSVRGMFVTLIAGILDADRGVVQLANAGHPPPLLLDAAGDFKVLPAEAPPLGIVPGPEFPVTELDVSRAQLYLFSDGLLEAEGADGSQLGYEGVIDVLRHVAALPKRERLARAVNAARERTRSFDDDVTLLLVEP